MPAIWRLTGNSGLGEFMSTRALSFAGRRISLSSAAECEGPSLKCVWQRRRWVSVGVAADSIVRWLWTQSVARACARRFSVPHSCGRASPPRSASSLSDTSHASLRLDRDAAPPREVLDQNQKVVWNVLFTRVEKRRSNASARQGWQEKAAQLCISVRPRSTTISICWLEKKTAKG
jgi:hypothetical protein